MSQVEGLTDKQLAEIVDALSSRRQVANFSLPTKSQVVRWLQELGKDTLAKVVGSLSEKAFKKLLKILGLG